jgi:tetratricopeptide (TPR) repeat protein
MYGRNLSYSDVMAASTPLAKPTARREAAVITVLSAIAVLGLVTVFALIVRFRTWQSSLASRTYQHGLNELQFGESEDAIQYFRSALSFQPENFDYQFSLAEALERANRFDEAETYLQTLWERQPQNGEVNVQLARLASHRHHTTDVLRYYHNAIYGIWKSDPDQNRRAARVQLVNFLIANNDVTQAQAELIAMQAGLPSDPNLHLQVADLFTKIQDYEHALAEYREVRQVDHKNVAAAAGAGEAAFKLGRFRTAQHFLEAALYGGDRDVAVRNMLETTWLIFAANPFRRGLSVSERIERVQTDFKTASDRLKNCMAAHGETEVAPGTPPSAPTAAQQLASQEAELKPTVRRISELNDSNTREDVMDFVFEAEEQSQSMCGGASGTDLALLLLGRGREVADQ